MLACIPVDKQRYLRNERIRLWSNEAVYGQNPCVRSHLNGGQTISTFESVWICEGVFFTQLDNVISSQFWIWLKWTCLLLPFGLWRRSSCPNVVASPDSVTYPKPHLQSEGRRQLAAHYP